MPKQTPDHPTAIESDSNQIEGVLRSTITLLHGASGSGKSRRIVGLERALQSRGKRVLRVQAVRDDSVACFDAVNALSDNPCATLALAGLAEPRIWALPVSMLSVGERSRLELAIAMCRACPGDVVIADEFCTPIDRLTAGAVCATVRRWARNKSIHFLAASAHEDLTGLLSPDLAIHADSGGLTRTPIPFTAEPIRYDSGTISDYDELGDQHYLGGRPATWTRVIRALRPSKTGSEVLAGVLVASNPTLNSAWRKQAWGDRYAQPSKRLNANRLNAELRCISRVVVDRRSRGLGIATGLVRAYLASAQTPATEAKSAMGSVCPFFKRAGMTEYIVPTPVQDVRLLDALDTMGIHPVELPRAKIEKNTLLHRELMHWARSSRILRGTDTPAHAISSMAACRLLSQPRAYAWRSDGEQDACERNEER